MTVTPFPESERPGPRWNAAGAGQAHKTITNGADHSGWRAARQSVRSLHAPVRGQVLASKLARLGDRVLFELLAELSTRHGVEVWDAVEEFSRIRPEAIEALGLDRAPFPNRLVAMRGGRHD